MRSECVFCKIVKGEISCHKIWEDENTLAFLDNFPKIDGHVIVIPKNHSENIFDIGKKELKDISLALKEISILFKENFGAEGINIVNNSGAVSGQEVPHAHFHVFPRFKDDGRDLKLIGEKNIDKNFERIAKKILGELQ